MAPLVSLLVNAGGAGGGSAQGQGQPGRCFPDTDGGRKQMSDIWTMIWKESKDCSSREGGGRWILPTALDWHSGDLSPIAVGLQWLELSRHRDACDCSGSLSSLSSVSLAMPSPESVSAIRWKPCWPAASADRAILLGKVIVTVGYAWGMALFSLLLGLVLVNLFHGQGNWLFYHL